LPIETPRFDAEIRSESLRGECRAEERRCGIRRVGEGFRGALRHGRRALQQRRAFKKSRRRFVRRDGHRSHRRRFCAVYGNRYFSRFRFLFPELHASTCIVIFEYVMRFWPVAFISDNLFSVRLER